jgi:glycosyltransferase involved in cell wall biosynthesis
MQSPLFSIITVVYNGQNLLPITAASVLGQTCADYEYLLIDGASKDATLSLIQGWAAAHPQVRYVSGRDKGLYDAMNKGLNLARGQYVWFMNAGDEIATPDTLQIMQNALKTQDIDVFYGDTLLVNDDREPLGLMSHLSTRSLPNPLQVSDYLYGMRVVHQSFVPKRDLCNSYRLDNLCADYQWCIEILKQTKIAHKVPSEALSRYLAGGISKQRHRQSLFDRFAVMRHEFGLLRALYAHLVIVLRAGLHSLLRLGKAKY